MRLRTRLGDSPRASATADGCLSSLTGVGLGMTVRRLPRETVWLLTCLFNARHLLGKLLASHTVTNSYLL